MDIPIGIKNILSGEVQQCPEKSNSLLPYSLEGAAKVEIVARMIFDEREFPRICVGGVSR